MSGRCATLGAALPCVPRRSIVLLGLDCFVELALRLCLPPGPPFGTWHPGPSKAKAPAGLLLPHCLDARSWRGGLTEFVYHLAQRYSALAAAPLGALITHWACCNSVGDTLGPACRCWLVARRAMGLSLSWTCHRQSHANSTSCLHAYIEAVAVSMLLPWALQGLQPGAHTATSMPQNATTPRSTAPSPLCPWTPHASAAMPVRPAA